MSETYKFPGGFDVVVLKKQDVIESINQNIIDKELALAIVEQCEIDAACFLREGRWTGIPFMGNIRIPKGKLMEKTPEQQALLQDAKDQLEGDKYILFRKQLGEENVKHIKQERYYRYIVSIAVNKNRKLFKRLCKDKGEYYARIYMYAAYNITSTDNEFITFDNYD